MKGPGGKAGLRQLNAPSALPRLDPDQPDDAFAEGVVAGTVELDADEVPPRPVVAPARVRRRHSMLMISFLLAVVLPAGVATTYLYAVAADQYASTAGFSVRTEQPNIAGSLLGGLSGLAGGSTTQDSDVLYEFIQSQEMVARVDAKLNLRKMLSKPVDDPVFAFSPDGSIEDLVAYWKRIVSIAYDGGTGLIQIEVHAFSAEDSHAITQAIYDESTLMINELSKTARNDASRYAVEDLTTAEARLTAARQALTVFRLKNQIVDPTADVLSQTGILGQLQSQLANELIQLDVLNKTVQTKDPRIASTELRISVIENRIAEERKKFGAGGDGDGKDGFATVMAEYERLNVESEFARGTYLAAMTALDVSRAEGQRQTRYLAAYVPPTLAETSEYPRRGLLSMLTFMFLTLGWSIGALIYYSVRDRR